MQHILVIGGSYFLGRVFLEQLTPIQGYQVYVFNRGNVPLGWQGIHEIRGDREISAHIRSIPRLNWDAVIDFCGYDPRHVFDSIDHLPGKIGHYIFISTTSVYADNTDVPLAENARKVTATDLSLGEYAAYGLNKWQAECALKQACRERSINYTILRPAIICGRYNYAPRDFFSSTGL